jgi:archaellum biogenesis protein FlaJ (TadC family)
VSSLLSSGPLYLSPELYSRFALSMLIYPVPVEVLALLLPMPKSLLLISSLIVIQAIPFLVPAAMSYSRRRGVEAELPFFLIALSIFSRASSPSIDDGLRRVAALGDGTFPELSKEAAILERDMTFMPGSPASVVEASLGGHPSRKLREFVRGFMTTLSTGKSITEYVEEEALRQVELLEARWKGFSESVGSLAEVSLMVLALFPVGLDMIAAAIPGVDSSQILILSLGLLSLFSVVLLLLMDSAQPVQHNATPGALPLILIVVSWSVSTSLYLLGLIPMTVSLVIPLAVSALGFMRTRGIYGRIRTGEGEVSQLLHDLAEESKAGVSLPEALSKVSGVGSGFVSIREPLSSFQQSIMLGAGPDEAQRRLVHPSWLVRLSFGMLSVAFATGAGFEQLDRLSTFFRRLSDARRNATRSVLPFVIVGVIVPAISISSMSFLSSFAQGGVPFLPSFTRVSESYILVSISAVALLTGLLLSKLFTQTTRHAVAVPILLVSTLVSLLVFGVI